MRLISNYKDFYDHFAKNRNISDQNYIWTRETSEVLVNFAIPRTIFIKENFRKDVPVCSSATFFIVWFCGRAIPVVEIDDGPDLKYANSLSELPDGLQKDWDEIVKNKFNTKYTDILKLMSFKNKHWREVDFEPITLPGNVAPQKIDIVEMHRKLNTPVFCSYIGCRYNDVPKVILNPNLSELGFYKFMEPFSAFKELESFISNQLAPRDVRLDQPVPDKINAESHGFDKYSFRKESDKIKKLTC